VPHAKIPVGPGYQTPFAHRIRHEAEILTGAVGMITSPIQAEQIIGTGQADAVVIAREFLRDPYWPLRAGKELGQSISWPVQYLRAAPRDAGARVPVNLETLRSCFEEHLRQEAARWNWATLNSRDQRSRLQLSSAALLLTAASARMRRHKFRNSSSVN